MRLPLWLASICCRENDPRPLRSSFSASTSIYTVCSNLAQEDLELKAIRTSLICRREMRDGKFGKERRGNKGKVASQGLKVGAL